MDSDFAFDIFTGEEHPINNITTYEDFLELSVKQLTDYLSDRGLNTSGTGRKVELIARAFAAMDLKLDII